METGCLYSFYFFLHSISLLSSNSDTQQSRLKGGLLVLTKISFVKKYFFNTTDDIRALFRIQYMIYMWDWQGSVWGNGTVEKKSQSRQMGRWELLLDK